MECQRILPQLMLISFEMYLPVELGPPDQNTVNRSVFHGELPYFTVLGGTERFGTFVVGALQHAHKIGLTLYDLTHAYVVYPRVALKNVILDGFILARRILCLA